MNAHRAAIGGLPVITGMRVISVAGQDSGLVNLCGDRCADSID
nr:hypothetical protein [uncultured Rhodopila sp.]